jgi:phosphopantothenoylcysteine decarboxylase/phosphopantothenate--cysteine ligase
VLGVGGGIAAYKSVLLLRALSKAGARVQVAMTPASQNFVGELTFQALSGAPVFTDLFDNQQDAEIGHIRVADGADLIIVAPATANLIARLVAGRANDPVCAAVLAARCPVLLAPSMNVNMWEHPATRANVETLAERGVYFVGPDDGYLACKWTGTGRLSEPEEILRAAEQLCIQPDLKGVRVLVSAGGTQESLDPVRFLGNRSSGKMGFCLANAAARRGAEVTLVAGSHNSQIAEPQVRQINVRSAQEMHKAIEGEQDAVDVIIMAAAVADYRPRLLAKQKLKKREWGDRPAVDLERTVDILAELGRSRNSGKPILVGFAAETENLLEAAQRKLQTKNCDLIVANDVSRSDQGFAVDTNAVELVYGTASQSLPLASKESIAHGILDFIRKQFLAPTRDQQVSDLEVAQQKAPTRDRQVSDLEVAQQKAPTRDRQVSDLEVVKQKAPPERQGNK